jgi:ATP-dependent RNA helicase RhlE
MVMVGGVNINPQIQRLKSRVDILVATPGRLLDHVQQGILDLSRSVGTRLVQRANYVDKMKI